jgi:hypothetical protein
MRFYLSSGTFSRAYSSLDQLNQDQKQLKQSGIHLVKVRFSLCFVLTFARTLRATFIRNSLPEGICCSGRPSNHPFCFYMPRGRTSSVHLSRLAPDPAPEPPCRSFSTSCSLSRSPTAAPSTSGPPPPSPRTSGQDSSASPRTRAGPFHTRPSSTWSPWTASRRCS